MGKKIRKSISVLLLALAIAVTQIPAPDAGAASHSDFVINGTTLISYEGTDYSVSIPRSVETIAQDAFQNNMVVERITVPRTVEQIGAGAFAGCGNLKEVNIPASVTEVGSGAFANCPKLNTILVDPANKQFQCLNGVLYNKDRTKLYQVLSGRKGDSFFFPDSVKDIDKYAFWGCDNIRQVYFGKGLTVIPEYAFSNCRGLKSITIPNMAVSIDLKAFEDCVNLEEAYIPPSVLSIHETAFDGCGRLKLLYEEGTYASKYDETFETTNVSKTDYEESENTRIRPSEAGRQTVSDNGTEDEKEGWVADVSDLDVTKLQDGMERTEGSDVMGKTKIVSSQAVVFLDNTKMQVQSGGSKAEAAKANQASDEINGEESRPATFYEEEEIVEKYVVVDGKTIADRAFYQQYDLKEYNIPEGIERIGDFAFAYTGLSAIQIPYGVKSIGYGAFYKCKNLSSVTIPQTVSTIEPSAFEDTAWLENWRNGPDVSDFLVVGNGILIGYKGNAAQVILPENVRKIGANVFEGHSEITSVSLPDRVEEIGEEAFKDCTALKSVTGGNYLEKICDRAFLNCPLETIRIPASVAYMGLRAFDQENNGKSDSVVFLGNILPKISCEKTAARFTNADYRKPVLNSVEVAVVNNGIQDVTDTILDDKNMGFRGIVCSISKEPSGTARGTVYVKYVSNGENGYPLDVPDVVWIYGKEYDVESINKEAYHGFSSEEEKEAVENQQETAESQNEPAEGEETEESSTASNIQFEITHPDYMENETVAASFSSNAGNYIVTLAENKEEEARLKEALEKEYGAATNENFLSFDLSMKTTEGNMEIQNLGKERLTVAIPVSSAWIDTPIVAVCLDNNGQLEFSACKQYASGKDSYVTFEAKHFSPYGLYQGENVPQSFKEAFDAKIAMRKGAEYDINYGRKDVSPDTGDYLEPKWILATGLLALALFLFFKRDEKDVLVK